MADPSTPQAQKDRTRGGRGRPGAFPRRLDGERARHERPSPDLHRGRRGRAPLRRGAVSAPARRLRGGRVFRTLVSSRDRWAAASLSSGSPVRARSPAPRNHLLTGPFPARPGGVQYPDAVCCELPCNRDRARPPLRPSRASGGRSPAPTMAPARPHARSAGARRKAAVDTPAGAPCGAWATHTLTPRAPANGEFVAAA